MKSTPPVLLPYQQQWIADKSPVKIIEKSRRIGLSWAEAADCALSAAAKDGEDSWYVGYSQVMAQEFINDVGFWAKSYQLSASESEQSVITDHDKDILVYRVKFASGKRVTALSSRPSNLRGKQGRVIIDEGAFHQDFPELMKAALALTMWGGKVHVISTHAGIDNAFNRLIEDIRAGRKKYSLHRVTIDDAISQGLVKRICLKLGKKWSPEFEQEWRSGLLDLYGENFDEELLVIPSANNRVYFTSALIESRMRPATILRFELPQNFILLSEIEQQRKLKDWIDFELQYELNKIPKKLKTYYGMDFGRSGDMSAIAIIVENCDVSRHCPLIIELRNVPHREQEKILKYVVRGLGRFRGGAHDARGNGHYLAESMQRAYGQQVQGVMLTEPWYRDNFPKYKAALEDRSLTVPKDSDVLSDHLLVKIDGGVPKIPSNSRNKGTDGAQRHGDTVVALLLAHYAATNPVPGASSYDSLKALFK